MYAIQAEDNLAEDVSVLPTLCADETSALFMMLAKAEVWTQRHVVAAGEFTIHEDHQALSIIVKLGGDVVYELSAWPITAVVDAHETARFIKGDRTIN